MPIKKRWSRASAEQIKANVPTKGGVYELKAFGELVYIGKASNLERRLLEHLDQRGPNYFRFETAGFLQRPSKMEQSHISAYGNRKAEMPPWNERDPR